jgi:PhnB protein
MNIYIPEGYGTVFPYMVVEQADKFVQFMKTVFNAKELGRTLQRNGRIANVRMKIGTSAFMVSEASQENMKAMPAAYYVYVESVDQTFESALSNGATKWFDPMDMPYEDRQAGITDPFGNMWAISNRLVQKPYDS